VTGAAGNALLLLHEGIADARMWAPNDFGDRWTLAPDLRGFGTRPLEPGPFSHVDDLVALLAAEGVERVVVVGCSYGGRIALELALEHPHRVAGLVLGAPGLRGWEWSDDFRRYSDREDELFEAGKLDEVVELNLRVWVDGPQRGPDEVDPEVRRLFGEMQLRAFELDLAVPDAGPERELDPPAHARLGEIAVPTLVVVGSLDLPDMHAIARVVADGIAGARLETIEGVAHALTMERPAEFDQIVLAFLDEARL